MSTRMEADLTSAISAKGLLCSKVAYFSSLGYLKAKNIDILGKGY